MKPTKGLVWYSPSLKGWLKTVSKKAQREAREMWDFYCAQWAALERRQLDAADEADAKAVAAAIQTAIQEEVDEYVQKHPVGKAVQCRRGCSHCCRTHVDVYPQEAALLREVAQWQHIPIDEARLARQAEKTVDTWRELSREDSACVFLGDEGECRVYEHRPGNCRKYMVVSDPQDCDMHARPGGAVTVFFAPHAEVMHSAAMTTLGAESMARALLSTLDQPEQLDDEQDDQHRDDSAGRAVAPGVAMGPGRDRAHQHLSLIHI